MGGIAKSSPAFLLMNELKLKYLFIFLSVALTFISLWTGFAVYEAMFGVFVAFLISFIFELLRLSTLYSINIFKGIYKTVCIVLYMLVAFVCFSAGVLSFNSKVIEKTDIRTREITQIMSKDVFVIKSTFSQKIDEQIKDLEKQKDKNDQLIARYPTSKTYPAISESLEAKIADVKNKRQNFFDSMGENPSPKWIADQKAILGLKDINDIYENLNSPISRAAHEFFGIDETALQKYAGIVLTLAIELGIILLSILGVSIRKINLDYDVVVPQEEDQPEQEERKPKRRLINRTKSSLSDSLGDKL